jgi:hypothetical protein
MNRFDLRVVVLALGGALASSALGACGGAASMVEPASPKLATDDAIPGSPDAALAAVDRAEAEIGRLLGGPAGRAAAAPAASAAPVAQAPMVQTESAAPAQPPPPPSPQAGVTSARPSAPSPAKSAATRREERADAPAARLDSCSTACTALASMERAADHLCGLAGDEDARCQGARTRVKDAGARVHAACPACAR